MRKSDILLWEQDVGVRQADESSRPDQPSLGAKRRAEAAAPKPARYQRASKGGQNRRLIIRATARHAHSSRRKY
jgi:hypothetical protein